MKAANGQRLTLGTISTGFVAATAVFGLMAAPGVAQPVLVPGPPSPPPGAAALAGAADSARPLAADVGSGSAGPLSGTTVLPAMSELIAAVASANAATAAAPTGSAVAATSGSSAAVGSADVALQWSGTVIAGATPGSSDVRGGDGTGPTTMASQISDVTGGSGVGRNATSGQTGSGGPGTGQRTETAGSTTDSATKRAESRNEARKAKKKKAKKKAKRAGEARRQNQARRSGSGGQGDGTTSVSRRQLSNTELSAGMFELEITVAKLPDGPGVGESHATEVIVIERPRDPWAAVRRCESNGNYAINTGNGFYGAYQFTRSTWNWVATQVGRDDLIGVRPDRANPADQDRLAHALAFEVNGGGLHHWPICGRQYGD